MTNKLKPCPFCGGEAKLSKESMGVGMGMTTTYYFAECTNCKATSKRFDKILDAETEIECKLLAVLSWNRRADNDR